MRITTSEKIWLIIVIILYAAYNFPGVPAYGDEYGMLIHGALTLGLLWAAVYIGLFRAFRLHPLKSKRKKGDKKC